MTESKEHQMIDTAERRKARGAFFTPQAVCDFMTSWAVRSPTDRVLEPSCGEAAFLTSAARRLSELGAEPADMLLAGVEIHAPSAEAARGELLAHGVTARVEVDDFLAAPATPIYSACVGNPPYIRSHDFAGAARATALEAASRQGVKLSRMASSWAAFVVHASAFLVPEGRLAFVLPAELLAANYASDVRRFLLQRFARVHIITFEQQVFPGVLAEALLLLCEGSGGTDHFEVTQLRSAEGLADPPPSLRYQPVSASDKWTGALLSGLAGGEHLQALTRDGEFSTLGEWGRIALGSVTGNNKFFVLTPAEAADLGLRPDDVVRVSPPGSRHLRSIRFTASALSRLGRDGQQTVLFRPSGDPSPAARKYIAEGERTGVHHAYKCRVRNPWWRVPLVQVPDLLVTCMNADTPRLAVNEARARHLNSVHGLYLAAGLSHLATPLAAASLNSVTLLGAEVVGRAYGGGVLKLEPGEALRLPLPPPRLVEQAAEELVGVIPALRKLIANGLLLDASRLVDAVVLERGAGMSAGELEALRESRSHLAERRVTRSARGR